jgi:hypothetical protein
MQKEVSIGGKTYQIKPTYRVKEYILNESEKYKNSDILEQEIVVFNAILQSLVENPFIATEEKPAIDLMKDAIDIEEFNILKDLVFEISIGMTRAKYNERILEIEKKQQTSNSQNTTL